MQAKSKIKFSALFHSKAGIVVATILGILSAFAFLSPTIIPSAFNEIVLFNIVERFLHVAHGADRGITSAAFAVFFILFYKKTICAPDSEIFGGVRYSFLSLLFSLSLSVALIVGESFRAFGDFSFIIGYRFQMLLSIILLLGYTIFFYTVAELAVYYLDKIMTKHIPYNTADNEFNNKLCAEGAMPQQRMATFLLERRPFLIPLCILMICWLPIWLIKFPGILTLDATVQLAQFRGGLAWSDHHPVLGSLILGALLELGSFINNDDTGIFIIVLFQMLLFASSCSFALLKIRKWGIPLNIRILFLLFWALNPIFSNQLLVVLKCNISNALLLFFFVLYIDFIKNIQLGIWKKRLDKHIFIHLGCIVAVGVLATLIRHNNLYITVISILLLLIIRQNARQRIAIVLAAVICFAGANIISTSLRNSLGAEQGCISEALSIPFQQTARFVFEHPELVTPEDRAAIDAVLCFDSLPELYVPWLSDPVKDTFRGDTSALPEYFKHWFQMGMRRPLTYVSATIANSYAYFAPVKFTSFDRDYTRAHHAGIAFDDEFENLFDFKDTYPHSVRSGFQILFETLRRIPLINLFFSMAHYTWLIIFMMVVLLKKSCYRAIVAFAPAGLMILTFIASPINGEVRYFLSVIAAMPLFMSWIIYSIYIKETERSICSAQ